MITYYYTTQGIGKVFHLNVEYYGFKCITCVYCKLSLRSQVDTMGYCTVNIRLRCEASLRLLVYIKLSLAYCQ